MAINHCIFKSLRESHQVSRVDAASILDVGRARITKLEIGEDKAGLSAIEKYCEAFGIPVWEFFYLSACIDNSELREPELSLRSKTIFAQNKMEVPFPINKGVDA